MFIAEGLGNIERHIVSIPRSFPSYKSWNLMVPTNFSFLNLPKTLSIHKTRKTAELKTSMG